MGRYGRLPFRTLAYLLRFGSLRLHRGFGCGYLLGVFMIAFEAEIPSEILPEHLLQHFRDALRSPGVGKLHCRFPVGVGTHLRGSMHHPVECPERVVYRDAVGERARFDKVAVPRREGTGGGVLLQDDQVAAHLRSGVLGKEVVREPHGGYQVAPLHKPLADRLVPRGIGHPLRGDEGDETPFAHRIDRLHKKVVVQRPRTLAAYRVAVGRKGRIEGHHVPERDVAYGKVVGVVPCRFDTLVTLHAHFGLRMEVFEDQSRRGIFLEAGDPDLRGVMADPIDESPCARTGFQYAAQAAGTVADDIRDGVRNGRRRIEGGQHRRFDAVEIAFVCPLVRGVLFQQGMQFFDERRKRRRFLMRQGFQHLLDRSEAAVRPQCFLFLRRGRAPLPFEREGRPERLDIEAQVLGLIVGHAPAGFGRRL